MVRLQTQRFGTIERPNESVIDFPAGIFGFELCRRWLLLADRSHGSLYWLQNIEQPELSLAVADPRQFVEDYQLKVTRSQLQELKDGDGEDDLHSLVVLAVIRRIGNDLVLNLKHPVLINPKLRCGCQVFESSGNSTQYKLPTQPLSPRQVA